MDIKNEFNDKVTDTEQVNSPIVDDFEDTLGALKEAGEMVNRDILFGNGSGGDPAEFFVEANSLELKPFINELGMLELEEKKNRTREEEIAGSFCRFRTKNQPIKRETNNHCSNKKQVIEFEKRNY